MTLTDFLLARIAEDEDHARRVIADVPRWDTPDWAENVLEVGSDLPATIFTARMSPARVLAECEAKRMIVEFHRPSTDHGEGFSPYCVGCWEEGGMDGAPNFPCRTARLLALPYADHPDYYIGWKP